jgi:hypothetical protein
VQDIEHVFERRARVGQHPDFVEQQAMQMDYILFAPMDNFVVVAESLVEHFGFRGCTDQASLDGKHFFACAWQAMGSLWHRVSLNEAGDTARPGRGEAPREGRDRTRTQN